MHILYSKFNQIGTSSDAEVYEKEAVPAREGKDLMEVDCDDCNGWMPLKSMEIGRRREPKRHLKELRKKRRKRRSFMHSDRRL